LQRWTSSLAGNVGGLAGGTQGEPKIIRNIGSNNIVLVNESASDTAANRFHNTSGANVTLAANQAALAIYDNVTGRWRVDQLGSSGGTIPTTTDILKGDNAGNATAFGSSGVGRNILALTNPSAISFVKIAADNTVSTRTPAQMLTDIGGAAS